MQQFSMVPFSLSSQQAQSIAPLVGQHGMEVSHKGLMVITPRFGCSNGARYNGPKSYHDFFSPAEQGFFL
jgi:hypothetical protein